MTRTKFYATNIKDFESLYGLKNFRAVEINDCYELVSFINNEPMKYEKMKPCGNTYNLMKIIDK